MKHRPPEKLKAPRPKWQRMSFRVLGILLFVIAIWTFVISLDEAESGDIEYGHNYKGQALASNRESRITFVLVCLGTVCLGLSMPSIPNTKKDDKISS
jgi:hypothetical protein